MLDELSLRPVEKKPPKATSEIKFYRGIRYLYLEDIVAIYRVFDDATLVQRQKRLSEVEDILLEMDDEKETLTELLTKQEFGAESTTDVEVDPFLAGFSRLSAELDQDDKYSEYDHQISYIAELQDRLGKIRALSVEDSTRDIASVERRIDFLKSRLEYTDQSEFIMKSNEYYFDTIEAVQNLRRAVIPEFDFYTRLRSKVVSIGGRAGIYVSWPIDDDISSDELYRIDQILMSRQSRVLQFLDGKNAIFSALLLGGASWILFRLVPVSDRWAIVLGVSYYLSILFAIGATVTSLLLQKTVVIPRYEVDATNLWRERGPEIVIALIAAIAVIVPAILSYN